MVCFTFCAPKNKDIYNQYKFILDGYVAFKSLRYQIVKGKKGYMVNATLNKCVLLHYSLINFQLINLFCTDRKNNGNTK